MDKWDYIKKISERGDVYGGCNGTLDLLRWCNKLNTASVTEAEARAFFEDPDSEPPKPPEE